MTDRKLNITVSIAGRPYSLTINSNDEEEVREAAKRVNQAVKTYSESFEYKDHQDLFAMMSLQFAANSIHLEYEKKFRDEKMIEKLNEIDELLSEQFDDEV